MAIQIKFARALGDYPHIITACDAVWNLRAIVYLYWYYLCNVDKNSSYNLSRIKVVSNHEYGRQQK